MTPPEASPESRTEPPATSSRYQVITTLGQGGMARVLLTLSRGPAGVSKLLVVKELRAELKDDPEFLVMFLDEARIAARLNHPNVIQTYEVSSDGEHPVIVMEYLEGQSLGALLGRVGRKAMPVDLHLHVLAQALAGLHYAHELRDFDGTPLNVVHRDVSPHNVFVTYDGQVKLVDFGIAKAAGSTGLTRAGVFKGKIAYAAPEQIASLPVDRRADVFSLGVMVWEAIAGRRLTLGEMEGAVMRRRVDGEEPKIKDVAPDTPDELARICDKATARDPADRYATAAELRAALEGYLETSKRVGAHDVGALVETAFAADRAKIRLRIDVRMKELSAAGPASSGLVDAPASTRGEQPTTVTPAPRSASTGDRVISTVKSGEAMPATASGSDPKRGRGLVALGGLAVAAILGLLIAQRAGRDASPSPSASATTAAVEATVNLSIAAEPPEARLFLDDVALATNPFHGAMVRSLLARRLRVSAPGFATEERLITFDRDLTLEMALKPAPIGASAPAATAAAAARPAPQAAGASAPRAATPTATAAPTTTTAAPGEPVGGPPRKKPRPIDDTF
jgi:tRNA A-37 threonylcarbamoyl transferase component Bud32